ncbi:periplasmic heavy metal sensor [Haloferula chungangensis]|uniref:Periplasmic heavy metal sensor n=1 Tax=Haloferula chungangensis TaxID=1048331 RepID=A0ABW2L7J2_9BACT
MMRRPTEIILWGAVTVLLSGLTAWLVVRSNREPEKRERSHDLHHWMHEQLVLTEAQHQAMAPFEKAYEESHNILSDRINDAGRELAQAVRLGKADSPEVEQALVKLNAAQAAMQRATLDHFFAMKEHLDSEQAEKLLEWTHDSIVHE